MALCVHLLGIRADTRVLDVGVTTEIWRLAPVLPRLFMLNEPRAIEHVGDAESQARFAAEIARVGKAYWVQTPNRRLPIEPHLCTPFVHWLPPSGQRRLLGWGTVWEWIETPAPDRREYYLDHYLARIRLLIAGGLRRLFPEARIPKERLLGCPKSRVAFRLAP